MDRNFSIKNIMDIIMRPDPKLSALMPASAEEAVSPVPPLVSDDIIGSTIEERSMALKSLASVLSEFDVVPAELYAWYGCEAVTGNVCEVRSVINRLYKDPRPESVKNM